MKARKVQRGEINKFEAAFKLFSRRIYPKQLDIDSETDDYRAGRA
jgi:hypothetical protein